MRGLVRWKAVAYANTSMRLVISVPLRGLVRWKARPNQRSDPIQNRFSPLAGISQVERFKALADQDESEEFDVSVPLRGLVRWKA